MYILGIHDGHHCGASLFNDDKIICAISEERLTRSKNEYGFPKKSINYCLKKAKIKKEQVCKVAVSTNFLPPKYFKVKRNNTFSVDDYKKEQTEYWLPKFYENKKIEYLKIFKNKIVKNQIYNFNNLKNEDDTHGMKSIRQAAISKFLNISKNKIFFYDHHLCHANYAYYSCPDRKKISHVFTCDGGGDGTNGSIWKVEKNKLKNIYRTNKADIGRIYRYITLQLNMKPSENEFKVMGLAGYSQKNHSKSIELAKKYSEVLDVRGYKFYYKKKIKDLFYYFKDKNKNVRFDSKAFAVQHFSEIILTKWFKNSQKIFGFKNIAFAGGVAQNIKAIKKILENTKIDYLFVPPGASDESLSLGAVYSYLSEHKRNMEPQSLDSPYIGLSFDKPKEKLFKKYKNIKVKKITNKELAAILAKGHPVARYCSYASEFGPRALGNRSILADPRDSNIINFVNRKIKVRDFWMPFAPSILDKFLNKYIVNNNLAKPYYMTYSYDATKLAKKHIPAALHPFDKTTRPQLVTKRINKNYYDLINEFEKITGVGALLNTSYNLHGEPIVSDINSSIKTFIKSGLKFLNIDDYLIIKND